MNAEDFIEEYIYQSMYPFDEDLTKEDIEAILENNDIKDYDLDKVYEKAIECQKELNEEGKKNLITSLRQDIDYYIEDYENSNFLSNDEIGKILVNLANSYFDGY